MHRLALVLLASLAVIATAAPAGATVLNSTSTVMPRMFVDGLGGVTFQHSAGSLFAGAVGVNAGRHVQIEAEFGRMSNVLTTSMSQSIATAVKSFETNGSGPINYAVTMPATFGMGLVRLVATPMHGIEPFVEGGLGAARVTTSLTAQQGMANIAGALSQSANLLADQTRTLMAVGGGISVAAGGTAWVDVGYRYGRIFTTGPAIDVNRVYAGVRFGF
jgi:opacity protein-like surface antigen